MSEPAAQPAKRVRLHGIIMKTQTHYIESLFCFEVMTCGPTRSVLIAHDVVLVVGVVVALVVGTAVVVVILVEGLGGGCGCGSGCGDGGGCKGVCACGSGNRGV